MLRCSCTGLKPGENEKETFESKRIRRQSRNSPGNDFLQGPSQKSLFVQSRFFVN
jgi:hypothetical protein